MLTVSNSAEPLDSESILVKAHYPIFWVGQDIKKKKKNTGWVHFGALIWIQGPVIHNNWLGLLWVGLSIGRIRNGDT